MQSQKKSQKTIQRQEKIKEIALKHFLSKGYEATNLKDIVKESGGSLSSIYETYKNKENLFLEIIKQRVQKDEKNIEEIIKPDKYEAKELLLKLATYMVDLYNSEDDTALMKILFSQIYNKNSNMIKLLKQINKNTCSNMLRDLFASSKDEFVSKNAELISHMFFDFIARHCFFRRIIMDKEKMSPEERKEFIDFILNFFMRLFKN